MTETRRALPKKRALLLSIQPQHAEKIFKGTKRVELRRVRPRLVEGDLVLVYVSTPIKALRGAFEVKNVVEAPPRQLWHSVASDAGLTREEFFEYFSGASKGFGIRLRKVWSLAEPLQLSSLRRNWKRFRPPQSYQYLSGDEVRLIEGRRN
ncbi:MAG: ASCH domain-containing protein [Elusimicrobia bacterium]|nr:ASCH domain-containing protein [Elusimicrobiota bacterium]MDE2424443.1 ASCH domain-containing protein [Elusimicrobiota bacterium]